jgi:glycerol-3-phosphate dehydrogenase (NAD(P)+)
MDTISIIGGGGWGTALAVVIAKNGHTVRLWVRRKELAEALDRERINHQYLPGIVIPQSIVVTSQLSEVAKADVLLFVTPATALREVANALAATASVHPAAILPESRTVWAWATIRRRRSSLDHSPKWHGWDWR